MKFKIKIPVHEDVRIIKRFLLFPRCIKDEIRWLCIARIQQRYEGFNYADDGWHDEKFIDNEE